VQKASTSSDWFLHKFRHTFATRNLQEHVCDIRTLQLWLGHSDLASTMVYLKAVGSKDVAARVNGSELGTAGRLKMTWRIIAGCPIIPLHIQFSKLF